MRCKFVLRLLGPDQTLRGWAEVFQGAQTGRFVLDAPVSIVITDPGPVAALSVHWTDVDAARWEPVPGDVVATAGQTVQLPVGFVVWVVPNDPMAPKPPVTVGRAIVIDGIGPALLGSSAVGG